MTRAEMNWKIVRSIIPIIVLAVFLYYTQALKPDYSDMDPVLITDANDLVWRFQMNEGEQLLNKVVQVSGNVTGIDSLLIIINHRLICAPDTSQKLVPIIGDSIGLENHQFAGSDQERAEDFQNQMDNPEIKAIWCAKGGYGTVRILDLLDFSRFKNNPKLVPLPGQQMTWFDASWWNGLIEIHCNSQFLIHEVGC